MIAPPSVLLASRLPWFLGGAAPAAAGAGYMYVYSWLREELFPDKLSCKLLYMKNHQSQLIYGTFIQGTKSTYSN